MLGFYPAIFSMVAGALRVLFISVLLMGEEVRAGSPTDWEQTVKAAEKEGQVTVYISGYVALITAGYFQKAFPKIKVVSVSGEGTQLTPRIAAERRAEKYLVDVYSGGGNSTFLSGPLPGKDVGSDQTCAHPSRGGG